MVGKGPFASFLLTPEPPALGPGPRDGIKPEAALEHELEEVFARNPGRNQQLIRALLLLWHDHLETAHSIAQEIDNDDGAFVHGIMHRREPDYGNAKYWFRRVGNHRTFTEIANRAGALLEVRKQTELSRKLLSQGTWDAFAFIDACEEAAQSVSAAAVLRELQRIETECLLEEFSTAQQ